MQRNDFELYHLYNCKTKIYPDGTAVALYCNKPKFCMIPNIKRKIEKFSPEYWNRIKYFDLVALFRGWFFDYSVNCIAFDENYSPHFKPVELVHPYITADPETGELLFRSSESDNIFQERKKRNSVQIILNVLAIRFLILPCLIIGIILLLLPLAIMNLLTHQMQNKLLSLF